MVCALSLIFCKTYSTNQRVKFRLWNVNAVDVVFSEGELCGVAAGKPAVGDGASLEGIPTPSSICQECSKGWMGVAVAPGHRLSSSSFESDGGDWTSLFFPPCLLAGGLLVLSFGPPSIWTPLIPLLVRFLQEASGVSNGT